MRTKSIAGETFRLLGAQPPCSWANVGPEYRAKSCDYLRMAVTGVAGGARICSTHGKVRRAEQTAREQR